MRRVHSIVTSLIDLPSLGWDDNFAGSYAPYNTVGNAPARVTRVDRGQLDAIRADGAVRAVIPPKLLIAASEDPTQYPCTGDWVVIGASNGPGFGSADGSRLPAVEAVLPRRTALVRAGAEGRIALGQVLAANMDTSVIVEGLWPEPDLGRIERLLALSWESGAQPVVVLTKADLAPDAGQLRDDVADAAPGASVYAVSAVSGDGVDAIVPYVTTGRTVVFLGPSGAGKSTLTNALAGEDVMATRTTRTDHKGRHMTAHRELVILPTGGMVIDTPGLRAVGLWESTAALDLVFADIEELAGSCRFGDCRHAGEPGCAVLAAMDDGTLPERRLKSWRKLQREAAWIASRSDARLRQERGLAWKRIHREMRRSGRIRP